MSLKKIFLGLCIIILLCIFIDYNIQKREFTNIYKNLEKKYENIETYEDSGNVYETKYIVIYKKSITRNYSIFNIKSLTLPFKFEAAEPIVRKISKISLKNGDKITYIKFANETISYDYNSDNELKNEPIGNDIEKDLKNILKNRLNSYPITFFEKTGIIDFSDSVTIEKAENDWLKNSNSEHYVKIGKIWKINYIDRTNEELEYRRTGNKAITKYFKKGSKKVIEEIKTVYFDDETYEVKEEFFYKNGKLVEWHRYNVFGDIIEFHSM